jgi:hypothetical protein
LRGKLNDLAENNLEGIERLESTLSPTQESSNRVNDNKKEKDSDEAKPFLRIPHQFDDLESKRGIHFDNQSLEYMSCADSKTSTGKHNEFKTVKSNLHEIDTFMVELDQLEKLSAQQIHQNSNPRGFARKRTFMS